MGDAASRALAQAADTAAAQGDPIEPDLSLDRTYGDGAVASGGGGFESLDGVTHADWAWELSPRFWFPALNGDFGVGGGTPFNGDRIGATEVNAAPAFEGVYRFDGGEGRERGRWSILFDAYYFVNDEETDAQKPVTLGSRVVSSGTGIDYTIQWGSITVAPAYRFYMLDLTDGGELVALNPFEVPDDGVGVWFEVYGGLRAHYLSADFEVAGSEIIDEEGVWADVMVGGRFTMDLPHGFWVDLEGDIGLAVDGEGDTPHWNIEVGLSYEPVEGLAAEIGFRHQQINYEGLDDFTYEGALAGLFGSLVIRF